MTERYTSQDCSTPSTRRPVKTYEAPHHALVRNLIDQEEYTLNSYRINNGSDYKERRYEAKNKEYDFSAVGGVERIKLDPPESYSSDLFFDEPCRQGDCSQLPDSGATACDGVSNC